MQVCDSDRTAAYTLGVVAEANADPAQALGAVREALATWNTGKCASGYSGTSTSKISVGEAEEDNEDDLTPRATEPAHIVVFIDACTARASSPKSTAEQSFESTTATAAASSQPAAESPLPTSQSTTRAARCARPCLLGSMFAALPERFRIIFPSRMTMGLVQLILSRTTIGVVRLLLLRVLRLMILRTGMRSRGGGRGVIIFRLVVSTKSPVYAVWTDLMIYLFQTANICVSKGDPPMPSVLQNAVCGPQKAGTERPDNWDDIESLNPCPLNACCNIWG